jgi:hypothetical protein
MNHGFLINTQSTENNPKRGDISLFVPNVSSANRFLSTL